MTRLDVDRIAAHTDVTLRSPANWTVVGFFACLSGLHLFIATTSFIHHRWESFMSVIFGVAFALAAVLCYLCRCELAVLTRPRVLRIRTGTKRLYFQRTISFDEIQRVRLTLLDPASPKSATIELVCAEEVIECPPSNVPRQEALCLAMTLNARLVKVYGPNFGPQGERVDSLASS